MRRHLMELKKVAPCIFCGENTEEQHETSIGMVNVHSECLVDLEEVLSVRVEDVQAVDSCRADN